MLQGDTMDEEEPGGVRPVPVINVELAAGHGAEAPELEQVTETRPFSETELRQLSAQPHNLSIVRVAGISMEPLLHAGDEVMIDTTAPVVLRDGLFAVRLGDALMVKHLQRLPEGRVRVWSENPEYQSFEVRLGQEPDDFHVIGRVVWGARRY